MFGFRWAGVGSFFGIDCWYVCVIGWIEGVVFLFWEIWLFVVDCVCGLEVIVLDFY